MEKKTLLLVSIALNIALGACALYFGYLPKQNKEHVEGVQKEICRVAVLTPVTHQSLEQIEKGFIETLQKSDKKRYEFTTFNANGNKTLMRAQVEEILQNNFDMIFTIGAGTTQMAKEISFKKQKNIPIVFGAVARPIAQTLAPASDQSNITGVIEEVDYAKQLALLLKLKPNVKRLLLVYDPGQNGGLEADKQTVEKLVQDRGIEFKSLEVFNTNDIYSKISTACDGIDVVMTLKDNTVVSAIDSLVKVCARYGTTLLVTDLDSVDKGASIGFGVQEYDFGVQSAQKARAILEDKKSIAQVPMTPIQDFKLKINSKTMQQQGLVLDDEMLFLMQSSEVV